MSCVLFDEKLFTEEIDNENVKIETIVKTENEENSDAPEEDITDTNFEPGTNKKKKFPCYYCEKKFPKLKQLQVNFKQYLGPFTNFVT